MSLRLCAVAFALVLVYGTAWAEPLSPAGRIKIVSGSAYVLRGAEVIPARLGEPVYESDRVRTGSDGRLGITLKDDTRFSLGPASEVRLTQFAYAPERGRLGLGLSVGRGVAASVSGRIAKLSPDAVRLETPGAIVGVRGTTLGISASAE